MADGVFPDATSANFAYKNRAMDHQQISYLLNKTVHPYGFDFKKNLMYFLEIHGTIDHNRVGFFYENLQKQAGYLLEASLDEICALEKSVHFSKGQNLLFIHHPGRCGSTLLHRILGSHPQIESFSEDLIFDNFFFVNQQQGRDRRNLLRLLVSLIRKEKSIDPDTILCFKMTGYSRLYLDELFRTFPEAKHIYISRDPVKASESFFNLFCIHPLYRFKYKYFGLRFLKIGSYKHTFQRFNDHGTFEKYYAQGILSPKIKKIRLFNIMEGFVLKVLLNDLVFKSIRNPKLITLDYNDVLDRQKCFNTLEHFLGLDEKDGFNESVYNRHSQEGSLARPDRMKKEYLSKLQIKKLREFEKYAFSLMNPSDF